MFEILYDTGNKSVSIGDTDLSIIKKNFTTSKINIEKQKENGF